MKEKFGRFKNEKIVVNVRSQKQYDNFMKMCEKQGLKWSGGDLPTKESYYNKYKEETCINLNNLSNLSYCDINYYKNKGYKIITYQFTKSDLKDNHIFKTKSGHFGVIKQIAGIDDYNDDLTFKIRTDDWEGWDIMEVWEFDKSVWKREEKPVEILDEVEKKWLKNFIKSTNIKVKYIVKYDGLFYNDREFLKIYYNINGDIESTTFPYFKENTMYQGMEIGKEYTLKELGLDK